MLLSRGVGELTCWESKVESTGAVLSFGAGGEEN